jgi:lysophospholipase L1-like esterase
MTPLLTHSQSGYYPYDIPEYDFIHHDLNRIRFPGDSMAYMQFLEKYSKLIGRGEGQPSVVHIGGSHLQADIYSERIRSRFQTFDQGNNGGRGFIFPYHVAGTNNPSNYSVSYTGRWEACRNVERSKTCILGLSGISVTTVDTASSIAISFPDQNAVSYDFNRVRVFYLDDPLSYDCNLSTDAGTRHVEKKQGIATWYLNAHTDSLVLNLVRTDTIQERFTLLGISLETEDPGVIYHAVGVNGAKIPSFLRCTLLPEHLAELSPDLVVLSIGTNDANTRYFNSNAYKQQYDTLIRQIRNVLPDAAILLTVPNDSYLYRRYVNRNTEKVREVILELGEELDLGVWDFYSVMGGLNSILVWQHFGLAGRDRIHFTREGYILIGDLFFNAFLKSYDRYIDQVNAY